MHRFSWDHNAFYQRVLIRQLPHGCGKVLDVGCGAGAFAARLAQRVERVERVERVDAIDRSPAMIELAERRVQDTVTCILGDVLEYQLPRQEYDAIVSDTALHHVPLDQALPVLARALRPGGVLAVVALPRIDLREWPFELAAVPGQWLFALAFFLLRMVTRRSWFAVEPSHAVMPIVSNPSLTTRDVRRIASAMLPGVQVRRMVFWRYFLVWHKPHRLHAVE